MHNWYIFRTFARYLKSTKHMASKKPYVFDIKYPELFESLSQNERHILYYTAFLAKSVSDKKLTEFTRIANITDKEAKACTKHLRELGIIVEKRPTYYEANGLYVGSSWLICVICHMLQFDIEWYNIIKKIIRPNTDLATITKKVADAIVAITEGKKTSLTTNTPWGSSSDYAEILKPIALIDDFTYLIATLDENVQILVVNHVFALAGNNDNVSHVNFIQQLYTANPLLIRTQPGYMANAQFYHYLRHGDICREKEVLRMTPDMVALQVEGFKKAYKGEMEEALKLLDSALKLNNRMIHTNCKNVFINPIANFLLYVVYAKDGSAASLKKLDQAMRKSLITESPAYASSLLIADYFKDESRHINKNHLLYSLCDADPRYAMMPSSFTHQLTFLFANYVGLTAKDFKNKYRTPDFNPERYMPHYLLLLHELSPYLNLSESVRTMLRERFGGNPLLCSIRKKEKWELILESMLEQSEEKAEEKKSGGQQKERVVYIFDRVRPYYSEDGIMLEVRIQQRLKNGEWGAGKKLSYSAYQDGRFEMNEKDRIIWQNNTGNYYTPTLEAVLPHLVGDDRLLYDGGGYTREPVTVNEVKPFLVVSQEKKGIKIDSNLPGGMDLDKKILWDFDTKNLTINYYPITQQQRQYFKQFRALGTIPAEAEPLLRRIFPNISEKVEIHSDFIEGGTKLKEVNGQTKVCLRIVPSGNNFNLGISVTPLEGGKQSFNPGTGNRIIYDEVDGERCQVKRTLSHESNNGSLFMDFVDSLGVETIEWNALLSPEDLLELLDFSREHKEEGYVEWPEGERVKLKTSDPSTWNISIKKNAGWFDLEGEIPIDDDTVLSVGQFMELMQGTRGRFVRIDDEHYLSLSENLRKQLSRLESLSSTSRGKAHIPAVGMALMGEALNGELSIKHSKQVDELTDRIRKSARLRPEVPTDLNATLRDYQVDGYKWISRLDSWGAGACLADDMGLGKTIQTIAFLLSKAQDGPALVVAPASVVPNWQKEMARFAPTLRCDVLNDADDRNALIKEAGAGQVVLSTYGLLVTQQEALIEKPWATICLDEAHTIKNRDTKTSGVCMKLQSQHRLILTGTPIQNHLGELWNLFQFINPGLLGSYESFGKKFITPIEGNGDDDRRQQLKRIIAPFMLRRTKQEVVAELPDKQDITISVELSKEEMAAYEVFRRKAQKELEEIQLQGSSMNVNALAEITRLRMCSCDVRLAEKSWTGHSSKIESFLDLALELAEGGNRALVFSQFTSFLDMVKDALDRSPEHKNIKYFYLDGSTPMRQRSKMVDAFQKGECQLFLISLKAGGLGLNLTGANYVIHLDPWWNPAIEQQATDRAHRIGQQQKVTVYHLVSQHTIEEKILRLHETKRDLADSLLEGSNQSHKITVDQLLGLIKDK